MYEVSDPALSGEHARAVLTDRGPAAFHNHTSRYPASTRDGGLGGKVRSFTNNLLYSCLQNGEKVSRDWITCSSSAGNIFSFACMLFSTKKTQFVSGSNSDWKHPERLRGHKKSTEHCSCTLALLRRSSVTGCETVNSQFVQQLEGEKRYWREVLKRVVAVI
ncbi:hypothetical protein ABVT39_009761 [Epinephelus coioides]